MKPNTLPTVEDALRALHAAADPEHARFVQGFFKTGPGQYGAGDRFLGLRVPQVRALARTYAALPLEEILQLLQSPWHEARQMALFILIQVYQRGGAELRERVYRAYLDLRAYVNNWDLVDASAPAIVGRHLFEKGAAGDPAMLHQLARSPVLWDRRIAILATQYFIRKGDYALTLELAEVLLHDPEDLIHKAVGWMLREVGNRDRALEEQFLAQHARTMPRTMLRYALEKFPSELRTRYLAR